MKKVFTFDKTVVIEYNGNKTVFKAGEETPSLAEIKQRVFKNLLIDPLSISTFMDIRDLVYGYNYIEDEDNRYRYSQSKFIDIVKAIVGDNGKVYIDENGPVDEILILGDETLGTMNINRSDISKPVAHAIKRYIDTCIAWTDDSGEKLSKTYGEDTTRFFMYNPGNEAISNLRNELGNIVITSNSEEIENCFKFELERYNTKFNIFRLVLKVKIPNGNNRMDKTVVHLGNLAIKNEEDFNACVNETVNTIVEWSDKLSEFFKSNKNVCKDNVDYSEAVNKFKEDNKNWNSVPNSPYYGSILTSSYTVFNEGPSNTESCPMTLGNCGAVSALEILRKDSDIDCKKIVTVNTRPTSTVTEKRQEEHKNTPKKNNKKAKTKSDSKVHCLIGVSGINVYALMALLDQTKSLQHKRFEFFSGDDKERFIVHPNNCDNAQTEQFKRFLSYLPNVKYEIF